MDCIAFFVSGIIPVVVDGGWGVPRASSLDGCAKSYCFRCAMSMCRNKARTSFVSLGIRNIVREMVPSNRNVCIGLYGMGGGTLALPVVLALEAASIGRVVGGGTIFRFRRDLFWCDDDNEVTM